MELGRTIINGNNNHNSRQTARKRERGTNPERCVYSVAAQSNGSPFSHEENVSEVSALLWLRARAPFPVFLRATTSRMRLCGRVIFYWEIQREKHPHSALFRKRSLRHFPTQVLKQALQCFSHTAFSDPASLRYEVAGASARTFRSPLGRSLSDVSRMIYGTVRLFPMCLLYFLRQLLDRKKHGQARKYIRDQPQFIPA